ncbi:ubiquitin-like protein 5 isoform X1 [Manacus candei]|uniref:ubiquitin-like protein 5 isoform X1 n=1 Tax=Manacus candei TaxID=415023 RepID=UPI002226CEAD|nr:ubiquitin-like protein 5 isoform X1 [Manacus candei]XP_051631073.1 ubiquitin-like protein 5 isoform X1 [Manacus candei]XP_051631074.1 ubiquitin-like protein 5 isoform X1 [Manacus candei]XP_051631075.1 ubiquitin-like protein 5 isoform X1 [Manacus candei]XP_051631076.1 ubiquitin-like protein 5 isoform X1 [Manacus candei]XP_051631077.1 ubiquitin-like protein 5 isoform X1 [Manacus candei]XP_051631078.1 ubiquitin-like protein 5 isoform X1 [Manacus candei]XP_051631079.1 ubiquitin-like protein 5
MGWENGMGRENWEWGKKTDGMGQEDKEQGKKTGNGAGKQTEWGRRIRNRERKLGMGQENKWNGAGKIREWGRKTPWNPSLPEELGDPFPSPTIPGFQEGQGRVKPGFCSINNEPSSQRYSQNKFLRGKIPSGTRGVGGGRLGFFLSGYWGVSVGISGFYVGILGFFLMGMILLGYRDVSVEILGYFYGDIRRFYRNIGMFLWRYWDIFMEISDVFIGILGCFCGDIGIFLWRYQTFLSEYRDVSVEIAGCWDIGMWIPRCFYRHSGGGVIGISECFCRDIGVFVSDPHRCSSARPRLCPARSCLSG